MKNLILAVIIFTAGLANAQVISGSIGLSRCDANDDFAEVDWRFVQNLDAEKPYLTIYSSDGPLTFFLVKFVEERTHSWGTTIAIESIYQHTMYPCLIVLTDFNNGESSISIIDDKATCTLFVKEFFKDIQMKRLWKVKLHGSWQLCTEYLTEEEVKELYVEYKPISDIGDLLLLYFI